MARHSPEEESLALAQCRQIRGSSELLGVVQYLEARINRVTEQLVLCQGPEEMFRLQGRAQELEEVIESLTIEVLYTHEELPEDET